MPVRTLQERFQTIWSSIKPELDYSRALVQLGIPEPNQVVLWYANRTPPEQILLCEANACETKQPAHIKHLPSTWATGRIEIRSHGPNGSEPLRAGTRYRLFLSDAPGDVIEASTAPDPTAAPSSFSFLAFSCNRPYAYEDNRPPTFRARDINSLNLLSLRATGRLGALTRAGLPMRPAFMIGLGDQVYVDPDPSNPEGVSLFTGTRSDHWAIYPGLEYKYIGEVYRRHFSLPPFDAAARAIPSAMTWDDHEIRDGWGSQGDEFEPDWQRYFRSAHAGFVAFQALRNPNHGGAHWTDAKLPLIIDEMDTQFDWGPQVHIFLADTRSGRNPTKRTVVSDAQLKRIKTWLASGKPGPQLFVLGLPMPLAFRSLDMAKRYTIGVDAEPADDLKDGWELSPVQRGALARMLREHFEAHPSHQLLILSGDIHESRIYFLRLGKSGRVFGHEVVTSGITNYKGDGAPAEFVSVMTPPTSTAEPVSGVHFLHRGRISNSPSFAEIVVEPDGDAFRVGAVFYTSAYAGKLANLAPVLASKPELWERRIDYWTLNDAHARGQRPVRGRGVLFVPLTLPTQIPKEAGVRLPDGQRRTIPMSPLEFYSAACVTDIPADSPAEHWENVLARQTACR